MVAHMCDQCWDAADDQTHALRVKATALEGEGIHPRFVQPMMGQQAPWALCRVLRLWLPRSRQTLVEYGARSWTRTSDPLINSQVL